MSHWNYRVIKKRNIGDDLLPEEQYSYGIYEVYYDDKKNIRACSVEPMEPYGSNFDELKDCIQKMHEALYMSVLDYFDDIPHGTSSMVTTLKLDDDMMSDCDAQDGC